MKEDTIYNNPDIDAQLKNPQFDKNLMNAFDPEALRDKLALQEAAAKQSNIKSLQEKNQRIIARESFEPSIAETGSNFEEQIPKKESRVFPPIKPAREMADYDNPQLEDKIVNTMGLPSKSMKEKIAEMEARLGQSESITSGTPRTQQAKSFLDEFGEETFYIKNVSNGHVIIADLERDASGAIIGSDKIPRGAIMDLLGQYDLVVLKKSRDLRVAISGIGGQKLLKRLTPEEYLNEITKLARDKEKIEKFRANAELRAATGENKPKKPIRPLIESKILSLQVSYSDQPHKGISPTEFIQWVMTENLTLDELDYILGSVDDKDIRMFVHEKKKDLL